MCVCLTISAPRQWPRHHMDYKPRGVRQRILHRRRVRPNLRFKPRHMKWGREGAMIRSALLFQIRGNGCEGNSAASLCSGWCWPRSTSAASCSAGRDHGSDPSVRLNSKCGTSLQCELTQSFAVRFLKKKEKKKNILQTPCTPQHQTFKPRPSLTFEVR